jgi:hypothetical protein
MFSTKTRNTIIATAALAALALPSAASALGRPGTTPQPVVTPTTAVPLKEAGSAGIKGYDNKKCQQLLSEYNGYSNDAKNLAAGGQTKWALELAEHAGAIRNDLEGHCLTVD